MYNRNNIFGNSIQKSEVKKRLWIIMFIFILLFCLLVWRIANYMYFKSSPLKSMFNAQYTIDETYGLRYKLTDCNGEDLLNHVINYYAIIDPVDYLRFNEYTSKYDMQALIITLRNYNKNYDLEKIKGTGSGDKLRYKIDEVTYNKLKDIKKVKGFYAFKSNDIVNNENWKIENVLINTKYNKNVGGGLYKSVSKSDNSLEMQLIAKTKNNKLTKIRFSKGVNGEIADGTIIKPKNNVNVRLTINKEIQAKIEDILHDKEYEKYGQIGVILMESGSGKIRAMSQKNDNESNINMGQPGTNGALPGSIFKVIVEQAGLDMNLITNNEITTVNPALFKGDTHNYKGRTQFTVGEALRDSLNNIFAQIGYKIGFENMYEYARKQGMLSKVLNLQQEESGKFDGDVSLSSEKDVIHQTSIGQKMRITPLEALSIPSTIINDGIYVQPSIVDAYINDNNVVVENITPKSSRVLKTETAQEVKSDMLDVVNNGTGVQTKIQGMNIGGKTGTTEYEEDKKKGSDGWFVGFFTIKNINFSMVVFVKNIDLGQKEGIGSQGGGDTAAPIFKKVINVLKSME
ncbi:penicillin-binding transpeptidase domain-containing protein [Clostridium lacusfryxellense]|uniref:penicillin-binding transpeptidase domain-containing protein n=1 Tax=Clostridium lacusfryxellense TaxID=205328 RepID=UPI001C0B0BE2|nr:penicillin-binding transpeptidase domain-containing protein [Clostridium lacusfryxellense]MBU3111392.1 penicillin-binding protein 2 [Clostridium lacusfryxellense]